MTELWPEMFISTALNIHFHKDFSFSVLDRKGYNYYGMTWDEDSFYFSLPGQIYRVNEDSMEKYGHVQSKDIHQILYHDKKLWVTNTSRNQIDYIDTETLDRQILTVGDNRADVNHINSVFFDGDDLYLAHNNSGNETKIQKYNKELKLVHEYDNFGRKIHNLYVENGFLYTLCSESGNIGKLNLAKPSEREFVSLCMKHIDSNYTFARGLAKTKDHFYIGVNKWETTRNTRESSLAWMLILDNDLKYVDSLKMPQHSQIKELRLAENDLAHNGIKAPYEKIKKWFKPVK